MKHRAAAAMMVAAMAMVSTACGSSGPSGDAATPSTSASSAPAASLQLPDLKGQTVAVAAHQSGELILFNAGTLTETRRVKLAHDAARFDAPNPAAVAISPDGRTAYCTLFPADVVAVVDLAAGRVTTHFAVAGGAPDGIAFSPISPDEDIP